ncbi:alpha/beta fold hydrolase [Anaerobiospirillum thomasii]|uniref:Lysophospholipase L2 n=1 Tax=Anaerobiospirillum thomasii TaxID=179995 RepID=A0A2X0WRI4_9GAMM|nr:alpha/beta fold hydrolase [Anaerobiospirillum thomasii]SPT69192.1 lysophospholipase L2 [Anaerobiospirillum thomasii]
MFLKSLEDVKLNHSLIKDLEYEIQNESAIEEYFFDRVDNTFISYGKLNLSVLSVTKVDAAQNLVIIPGRGECEYKYAYLLYCLKDININIYILFVRGNGKSSRYFKDSPKCHIESFSEYTDDIDLILSRLNINNYVLMAFSLGCLISLSYYIRYNNKPQKMALLAPFIYPYFKLPDSILFNFTKLMSLCGFKRSYTPHGKDYSFIPFNQNHHTHCQYRYEKYHKYYAQHPQLPSGGPTYNFVYKSMLEQKYLLEKDFSFDIPVLSVISMEDKVVNPTHALEFFKRHSISDQNPQIFLAHGAYHDLLNEESKFQTLSLGAALDFLIGEFIK